MTSVITVPPSLDDYTFEQVVDQLAAVPPDAKVIVDARHTRWASPFGLTALLTLGQTREERPSCIMSIAWPCEKRYGCFWPAAFALRRWMKTRARRAQRNSD